MKNVIIYLEPVIFYRWCVYSLADRAGGVSGPTGRDGEVQQRVSNAYAFRICNLSTSSKHGKRKAKQGNKMSYSHGASVQADNL